MQAFTVFPLDKYDVILGKPWLAVHNPLIDFRTNYIQKRRDENEPLKESPSESVTSGSNEASNIELNFISGCQARHALRNGDEGFIAWVSEASKTSDNDWSQLNIQVEGHHHREMNNLLRNFGGSFPKELPRNLPPKRTVNHEIDLEPGHSPPSKPLYRLSQPHLNELQTRLSALLERGFIEPSKSPFGAPVFFVRKSDGSIRLVCGWRELNRITIKNEACLPNVDDLFDTIQGSKYFTKLDLHSSYNQVRVKVEDTHKTAINTPLGHFEFCVMGFGLCNAPATFQSLMNDIRRP